MPIPLKYDKCIGAYGAGDCNHTHDVSLTCTKCTNTHADVRIVGENGAILAGGHQCEQSGLITGRLEIYANHAWGTVCSDGFDQNAAQVACRSMGHNGET